MAGLLKWMQQSNTGQAGAPPPFQPPPGMPPAYLDALHRIWQRYTAGGATPPITSPQQGGIGGGYRLGGPPATSANYFGGSMPGVGGGSMPSMNPSSIRVDFHAPPEPQ